MDGTELFQKNHNKFTHRLIVKLDNCLSLKSTHHDDLVVILSPRVLTKKIQMSYFKGSMGLREGASMIAVSLVWLFNPTRNCHLYLCLNCVTICEYKLKPIYLISKIAIQTNHHTLDMDCWYREGGKI